MTTVALRAVPDLRSALPVAVAVPVTVGLGALTARSPLVLLLGLAVCGLAALVWRRPEVATYVVVFVTPLTAGIDRGAAIPLLRVNEAVALVVGGTVALKAVLTHRTGRLTSPRLAGVEKALVLLAVTSSVLPLLWLALRQQPVTPDDLTYSVVLWKLLGIYAIARFTIRTPEQLRRCLWLSLLSGAVVAVVAVLQVLGLLGVPRLVSTWFAPYGHTAAFPARGSSTLGLPAATADLFIANLAIVVGLWAYDQRSRALVPLGVLFVLGAMSAGEFSSALGLLLAAVVLACLLHRPRALLALVPVGLLGSQLLQPVLARRFEGFQSASGIPDSWVGRFENLSTYFWPQLFSHGHWVLGVRPAARVAVPSQATGFVWIESGYTWLLWAGGLPLLGAFVVFVVAALRSARRSIALGPGPGAAVGVATCTVLVVMTFLMLFDPHLTYRGAADELFVLVALSGVAARAASTPPEPLRAPDNRELTSR
ncbi:MAG: hypothetical protein JWN55_2335 [Frankiales bacterium]|nr:hypothetical protein [Frankiales bacterium]